MRTTVYQFWRFVYHHEQSVIDHYARISFIRYHFIRRSDCTYIIYHSPYGLSNYLPITLIDTEFFIRMADIRCLDGRFFCRKAIIVTNQSQSQNQVKNSVQWISAIRISRGCRATVVRGIVKTLRFPRKIQWRWSSSKWNNITFLFVV